jgi:hypothetical protein
MTDDLTVIAGIARRRAEVLADELGVSTFADLAAQDVDTVVAALRSHRQPVAPRDVADWIAEAARRSARPDDWTMTALFLLIFEHRAEQRRTVVRHVDTSAHAEWTGYVTAEPTAWIAEQLDTSTARAPAASEDAVDDDAGAVGRAVHVRQPPDAARALPVDEHGNVVRPLRADMPFAVELEALDDDGAELALGITAYGAAEPIGGTWSATAEAGAGLRFGVPGLPPGLYQLHAADVSQRQRRASPLVLVE